MADIIDTAQRLKSFSVTLPFPLTASTVTPYQLSIVLSATNQFPSRGALPFPATRRVPVASLIWSLFVSKGGCDV